jgi:ABC-type sugar transport system ATPase subunit
LAEAIPARSAWHGTYGIRAEDVTVEPNQTEGTVGLSVFGSELMGSEQFIHGVKGKLSIVSRAPMDFKADIGSSVWMNLSSPNAHLFNASTEQALV